MEIRKNEKNFLIIAAVLLMLSVFFDAAGAHIVAASGDAMKLSIFKTGARYHIYYGILLLVTTVLGLQLKLNFNLTRYFHLAGITLFSFGCYAYSLTGMTMIKKVIPFGGISFAIGWAIFVVTLVRNKKNA